MSAKRSYSTYLCSTPAAPLVTAHGFGAPRPQALQSTPVSSLRQHIPGAWPHEDAAAAYDYDEIAPPRTSVFTTLGKWATTVSIANLFYLPKRLTIRFFRQQTIKAVPVLTSPGSNKKRLIAAGVVDEVGTPSPSVRVSANKVRRQLFPRTTPGTAPGTTPASHDFWSTRPLRSHQAAPTELISPPTVERVSQDRAATPASVYVPDNKEDDDGDISMERDWSLENAYCSTPNYNPETGSPLATFWNVPQMPSPADQTPSRYVQHFESPIYHPQVESPVYPPHVGAYVDSPQVESYVDSPQVDSPAFESCDGPEMESPVCLTSLATASPCPKEYAASPSTVKRPSGPLLSRSTVTPLRRQLVNTQLEAEKKRLKAAQEAEAQMKATMEERLAESEAAKNGPTEATETSSDVPPQANINPQATHGGDETDESFVYENDLSFLSDAPTPKPSMGVRWTKFAGAKHFYFDERVSEMLDSTLESITSDPNRSYWDDTQNNELVSSDDQTSSPSCSSAASSPRVTAKAAPVVVDDGFEDSSENFDALDDSLEESQISFELYESLQEAIQNRLALEAAAAPPPPPPPKPLITPLSSEEVKVLEAAAAKTSNGREADMSLVKDKLEARDFATLLPRQFNGDSRAWLNDNIVNEYLAILFAHKKKQLGFEHKTDGPAPPVHAFSSFWYQSTDTSRWSKKVQLKGKQYLDAQLIVYPICDKGHWRLLAVYPQSRTIEYFDSLGLDGGKYIDKLKIYLEKELGELFIPGEWTKGTRQRSTQQLNGSDCGVFTVLNALMLLRGDDEKLVLATNGMHDARQRIAVTLLAGRPTTEMD
ncbi:hypothetical protein BDW02DRAFT_514468 [Decorospora gaudefroyi]|uniref:Ubiquitin-like protease family profile domain-containing protein n=1 Tax=Decorospora gaudefroyi TaxID=184978 RepID=A0A6A5KZR0_9PLEO|nr:hypothetical protein BDW02DRAFT_514468 [Decorospora gaudefroyi]